MLPEAIRYLKQVHGKEVVISPCAEGTEADAILTREAGRVCAIRTADCVPILLTDLLGTEVAAIHAGWRGLVGGVIENTFAHLKTPAAEMMAWIGPAISAAHYEVGADVRDAFLAKNKAFEAGFSLDPLPMVRYQANLALMTEMILRRLSVTRIYQSGLCTFSDPKLYSYRRDYGAPGRLTSVIYIEKRA